MYRVVIIDDEPIIVTGLSKIVPWEKYDCEVVGTAYDGQEGLELIRELRPDIVFSDIYMPKMDGLLMTAALKSEFEDIELSILTGYRDFDLVQQALSLGVARFILKPSNMEELEEAVEAMTKKLRKKGIWPERGNAMAEEADDLPQKNTEKEEYLSQKNTEKEECLPQKNMENQDAEAEKQDSAGSFIVKNALAYIRENYNHKITLTEVADNTYVSQWHLSKLLNRHTGQSFSEILYTTGVVEAKELLKNPALRIGDVAEEVGFLDLAHFSRVFKKVTGISANEYRNRLQ